MSGGNTAVGTGDPVKSGQESLARAQAMQKGQEYRDLAGDIRSETQSKSADKLAEQQAKVSMSQQDTQQQQTTYTSLSQLTRMA